MFDHSNDWTKMHPMTGPPTWIDPIPNRVSDNDFGGGIIHIHHNQRMDSSNMKNKQFDWPKENEGHGNVAMFFVGENRDAYYRQRSWEAWCSRICGDGCWDAVECPVTGCWCIVGYNGVQYCWILQHKQTWRIKANKMRFDPTEKNIWYDLICEDRSTNQVHWHLESLCGFICQF